MITRSELAEVVESYSTSEVRIGCIGSHSALDICDGAKDEGFETVVVCQRGREKPYVKYYRRIIDHVILLDRFADVVREDVQKRLRELSVVFVPNRSFSTYVGYENIEDRFLIPLFGSRAMLRTEERDQPRNQYYLLEKAGIRYPKRFSSPEEIDRLVIVKVPEAKRRIERAFFFASSPEEFRRRAEERVRAGLIDPRDLENAVIEEFVVGALFNFNYFYSPLDDALEFLGIDRRIQTNLDGILRLPASEQLEAGLIAQNIEIGHEGATIRESMLEKVFDIGERFVEVCKQEYPPGIIGPFALQGAVTTDLEICIFDVSPRVPGSPIISTTSPYSKWFYGEPMSTGRRIAREVRKALDQGRLLDVVT